jgi:hypothetical protein
MSVPNTFPWKRLINFIPIYSSPQYVYAFFLIEVYLIGVPTYSSKTAVPPGRGWKLIICKSNIKKVLKYKIVSKMSTQYDHTVGFKKNGNCQKKFCQILLLNFYSLKRPFRI